MTDFQEEAAEQTIAELRTEFESYNGVIDT